MNIKPSDIFAVMDMAKLARENGDNLIPCFRGDAGLGKSQIVFQWAALNEMPVVDRRLALDEAPDLKGFPHVTVEEGTQRTIYAVPSHWPTDPKWQGVIFLDEVNRADPSVTNACMQLFTDRKLGEYTLPQDAILVTAINGDTYDVNPMDAALADRQIIYDVAYDKSTFQKYMASKNYNKAIQSFIKSGNWTYRRPDELADGETYVSPRSWSRLNMLLRCNPNADILFKSCVAVLGASVGREFYAFMTNDRPLYAADFADKKAWKANFKRLDEFNNVKNRRADLLKVSSDSIIDEVKANGFNGIVTKDLAAEVAQHMPLDLAVEFLSDITIAAQPNTDDKTVIKANEFFFKDYPKLREYLKDRLSTQS